MKAELNIKSNLKELYKIRSFIREFCEQLPDSPLADDRISDIELATNEVVTNIVKYAYHHIPDKQILIKARAFKGNVVFLFYDWGNKGFSPPTQIPKPKPGQVGQYGLYIIERLVDKVIYSRDETGRNCCCLIVNVRKNR